MTGSDWLVETEKEKPLGEWTLDRKRGNGSGEFETRRSKDDIWTPAKTIWRHPKITELRKGISHPDPKFQKRTRDKHVRELLEKT